jgi:hypothetical protein
MNNKHRKTLEMVFTTPISRSLKWSRVEALFVALGADVIEGSGSRVGFKLHDDRADFHRPHPGNEAKPYQIRAVREFLERNGVKP